MSLTIQNRAASGSGSSRPPSRRYAARKVSTSAVVCSMAKSEQMWATSRSGGPHDVSAQSISPVTVSPCHRVLPRWKSRCSRPYGVGGRSGRPQVDGLLPQVGPPGPAWNLRFGRPTE